MLRSSFLEQRRHRLWGHQAIIDAAERISRPGTFLHDPSTNEAVWSLHLKRIFGFSEDDSPVKLETFLASVHPDDLAALHDVFASLQRVGDRYEHVFRILLADGRQRDIQSSGEIVRMAGYAQPVVVGTTVDRTELEAARQLIIGQAAALEAVEAELLYQSRQSAMGTMAATLAHELNQPLTAIAFSLAAARRTMGPDPGNSAHDMLRIAEENALRAGEIIRRLRQSVQTGEPKRERFATRELVEEAVRFSSLGRDGVRIELDVGTDEIEGADRVQIQQVLVNLIRNACQATAGRPDPLVTVTARIAPDSPQRLRVAVDDNGPGIPERMLPRLFDGGITTKAEGMGLGLSICRTIVEAHGGRLWAENIKAGARIAFEIPTCQEADSEDDDAA